MDTITRSVEVVRTYAPDLKRLDTIIDTTLIPSDLCIGEFLTVPENGGLAEYLVVDKLRSFDGMTWRTSAWVTRVDPSYNEAARYKMRAEMLNHTGFGGI